VEAALESDAVKARLVAFIQRHEFGVIATATPAAVPEAALVNIAVTPALEIIFETTTATRKCANLRDNPLAAMVIGWENDQSLQMDGAVELLEGSARERFKEVFMAAFPQKASHEYWPGNDFYCIRPYWARLSNYNTPRKVEEFSFPGNEPVPSRRHWWQPFSSGGHQRRQND
jgi:hypothetical protein